MKTIYVFLAEGFEEVEALTPVDVLRRAGLPVKTVSITGVLTVNGAHGVPVVADMVFEEVKEGDAEMIVLPGGLPGATNLDARPDSLHVGFSGFLPLIATQIRSYIYLPFTVTVLDFSSFVLILAP